MNESAVVDVGPYIGVISQIIMWVFFLITLCVLKNFIAHGISIAITELLLKARDTKMAEKVARWFGNGDEIMEQLIDLKGRMEGEAAWAESLKARQEAKGSDQAGSEAADKSKEEKEKTGDKAGGK